MERDLMMCKEMALTEPGCSYDLDIEPDDIEVEDTVTVICPTILHHLLQLLGDPMTVRLEFDGF